MTSQAFKIKVAYDESMRRLSTLLVLITVVCAGGAACTKQAEPQPASSLSPIETSKARTSEATKLAKDWQGNATLIRVFRLFEGSLTPDPPKQPIYVFASFASPSKMLHVSYDSGSPKTSEVSTQPFELALNTIKFDDWHIDPDAALQKAEDGGGRDFREAHLAGYTLLQQLTSRGGFPLQWYFRYDTGDGSRKRLEIYIDAGTGTVASQKELDV